MEDIRSRATIVSAVDNQLINASGTVTGEVIDLAGFEALDICINLEVTTGAPVEVELYEDDVIGMGTETEVDADFIIGELNLEATATGTQVMHIGYVGNKEFVRAKIKTTGSPSIRLAGIAYKGKAKTCPTAGA